jgi:hypothetical protein
VKLHSALKPHGFDCVVIPQNEHKAPSVKFAGPRDCRNRTREQTNDVLTALRGSCNSRSLLDLKHVHHALGPTGRDHVYCVITQNGAT